MNYWKRKKTEISLWTNFNSETRSKKSYLIYNNNSGPNKLKITLSAKQEKPSTSCYFLKPNKLISGLKSKSNFSLQMQLINNFDDRLLLSMDAQLWNLNQPLNLSNLKSYRWSSKTPTRFQGKSRSFHSQVSNLTIKWNQLQGSHPKQHFNKDKTHIKKLRKLIGQFKKLRLMTNKLQVQNYFNSRQLE